MTQKELLLKIASELLGEAKRLYPNDPVKQDAFLAGADFTATLFEKYGQKLVEGWRNG